MKIVADENIPFVKHYFEHYGKLVLKPGRNIDASDVKDANILLVRSITKVDEHLLKNSAVTFVGSVTAGGDHLDTDWLDEMHIQYQLAAAFNAPPVADYVVSAVAALQKINKLADSGRAAVIGVGSVGRLVVERLQNLSFDVIQIDPLRAENETDFTATSLQDVRDVDLISVHVPLTKQGLHPTYHFLDKKFLQAQKENCVLMNASRGAVIDSKVLQIHGKHLLWCFDVWEHEPNIDTHILSQTTLASPHIAGYSVQSKIRGIDMIYRAMCERGIILPRQSSPVAMPTQALSFRDHSYTWQDIVLAVYNPNIMTEIMKATLSSETNIGFLFDEMRNQFHYRHEFHYTQLMDITLSALDAKRLKNLGFLFPS